MTKTKANPVECPGCHEQVTTTSRGRLRQHAIGPYRNRWRPEGSTLEPTGGSSPCDVGGLRPAEARRSLEDQTLRERTEAQLSRQREIAQQAHIVRVTWDELDRGFVIVQIDEADANELGVWIVLSITPNGRVASYDLNQPRSYPTFAELIEAKTHATT